MRNAFISTLCEIAQKNNRIWLLTGDLGYSVLEPFADQFPDRFINLGVAEQNMTGVATGLALEGKIVFTYSIANFPVMRCLEQIRNDVCYHKANVKIVSVGSGLAYGAAGYSHYGIEDIALMKAMPNMSIIAPGDPIEAKMAVHAIINWPGPCYVRLGKGGEPIIHDQQIIFEIGKAIPIRFGKNVTIISTGAVLSEVMKAVKILAEKQIDCGVVSMPTIKPLDINCLLEIGNNSRWIFVIEEHSCNGGLGDELIKSFYINDKKCKLTSVGLSNYLTKAIGCQSYLRKLFNIDSESLAELIFNRINGLC